MEKNLFVFGSALFFSLPFTLLMGGGLATATNIDTSVKIEPSLTVNIPANTVTMNLDPANHDFDEKDLTITVGTNNRYGYKLYISSNNGGTDLINIADNSKIIPNLTSSYTTANFPANNWGFRFSDGATSSSGNYGAFTSNSVVSEASGPTNEKATTLGFGAKIDYTKPSGQYQLNLNFKALPTVTQEYMQNLDPTTCIDEPTTVIDSRDEKVYTIRRLADGRCWMVENLRFTGDPNDAAGTMTLKAATSNVAADTTLSYSELATGSSATADSYTDAKIHVGTVASGMSPIDPSSTVESNIPTVWYNYVAATAGTITGSSNSYEAQYDICPKGWRLPDYGEEGGLKGAISANLGTFSPLGGGYYYNGSHGGTHGMYWSSSASGVQRYRLAYDNTELLNINPYERTYGYYIRCILNEPIGNVTTMQQLASMSSADKTTLKNSMVDSKIYTLRDTRDNQIYTVAKLKDGNLWMSENLNLGATTLNGNLTSSNTNLSTTITKTTFEGWKKTAGTQTYTAGEFIPVTGIDSTSKNSYGTLYNYCATSAKTICATTNTSDATYDICPAGWRLPTGNATGGEYGVLYSTYYTSVAGMRNSIINGGAAFSLSGTFANAAPVNMGTAARYWTSTRYLNRDEFMYNMFYSTGGSIIVDNNSYRYDGGSVRCLLKS